MTDEERKDEEQPTIPEVLPVLPLRDIVIFPFMIVPLYVSRDKSIKAVDQALAENRMILLAAQKNQDEDDPGPDDIYPVGTAALIMRMLKLPDGRIRVLVQGLSRARTVAYEEVNAAGGQLYSNSNRRTSASPSPRKWWSSPTTWRKRGGSPISPLPTST